MPRKHKIKLTISIEKDGYSAGGAVGDDFILTRGTTLEELHRNILEAANLYGEDAKAVYQMEDIELTYDLQSFFDLYQEINTRALAHRIGMNYTLLNQYANGFKTAGPKQVSKILSGIRSLGKELSTLGLA